MTDCDRCKAWDDLLNGDVPIRKFLIENGIVEVEVDAEHWAVKLLAYALGASLLDTLDSTGAENYTETKVELRLREMGGPRPIVVTVMRPGGKTPHELRREAEAKLEVLGK